MAQTKIIYHPLVVGGWAAFEIGTGGSGSGAYTEYGDYATAQGDIGSIALGEIIYIQTSTGSKYNPFASAWRPLGFYVNNGGTLTKTNPILEPDPDPTLAANSSVRVVTQDAIKAYVDNSVTGYVFEGERNNNVTNSYLRSGGVFTNVTPIHTYRAMTLTSISASTRVNETWIAEIHNNGVLIPGATLTITGVSEDSRDDLSIAVPINSNLSFYVNGTGINRPRIIINLI